MVKKIQQNEFEELVLNQKGIVLVDFFADWCGPCKMLGPVLEQLSEEKQEVTICKVNIDENEALAQEYQVQAIPNLIFFKDGKKITRKMGFQKKQDLLQILETI